MFEVWDRVTGNLLGEFETREEAESHLPAAFKDDFLVFDTEDDELAS